MAACDQPPLADLTVQFEPTDSHSFLRVLGKDMTGKDMTGSDRRGKDMTEGMTGMTGYNLSQVVLGKGMTGKDMTGSDRRGKDMTARPSCP